MIRIVITVMASGRSCFTTELKRSPKDFCSVIGFVKVQFFFTCPLERVSVVQLLFCCASTNCAESTSAKKKTGKSVRESVLRFMQISRLFVGVVFPGRGRERAKNGVGVLRGWLLHFLLCHCEEQQRWFHPVDAAISVPRCSRLLRRKPPRNDK